MLESLALEEHINKLTKMNQEEEDRISKLPDAILCEILSFLDLKTAICTCILSKRWKPLWTFLHDLEFDFNKYLGQIDPLHIFFTRDETLELWLSFLRFVNGVLSYRDDISKIGKFRLAISENADTVFFQNCIDYAAGHKVEEVEFDAFCFPKPVYFPLNEFPSLRKLRLKYYTGNQIIPKPFCLPNLKVLYLEHFPFKDGDDFCLGKEPFSCFPNLEELILDCCEIDGLVILAPELKVFELKFEGFKPPLLPEPKISKINMPKLKSFTFHGEVSLAPPMEELPSLDFVYLDAYTFPRYKDEVLHIKLIKLLEKLRNAKTLTLSFETIQVLSMDLHILRQYPSPFVNLKHLKIGCAPRVKPNDHVNTQNVMDYLTSTSVFGDSMIVEYSTCHIFYS